MSIDVNGHGIIVSFTLFTYIHYNIWNNYWVAIVSS